MDLLKPLVAEITGNGLSVVGEVTAEELGLAETDAVVEAPLAISLELNNIDGLVSVVGVLEGTISRECVRCLTTYKDLLAFAVRGVFIPESKSGPRQLKRVESKKTRADVVVVENEEEPDDQYPYQGHVLELAPMLREHIILAAPMQPICSDECLGLCARCGKNLNEGLCQCVVEPPPSNLRLVQSLKGKSVARS